MTTYEHRLPFGGHWNASRQHGEFRLWAPAAVGVDLVVRNEQGQFHRHSMAGNDGWFTLETDRIQVGDFYGFSLDGRDPVPDPASRWLPEGVHGLSQLIDPRDWVWRNSDWRGRPWREAVLYELHVGTFTPEGTYAAAAEKLERLAELGVTGIELLPIASFPGDRGWGYDGVQPFAPFAPYGRPNELKALIDRAHELGLMVLLDVVYNHFGPEGNYLPMYAPYVQSKKYHTPWGPAFNVESPNNGRFMREYFINNAIYWLNEYRFDGLRFDAVQAIHDHSNEHIMCEMARRIRVHTQGREIWLIQENGDNQAHWYERDRAPCHYDGQWNDDFHHAIEVIGGGETGGVFSDYADDPSAWLARSLATGFGYQGERSDYFDMWRGESSAHLPQLSFINYLENHDQVGNRPHSRRMVERLPPEFVRVATELLMLMPTVPMLFMGQEWGARAPFPFFCDFDSWLIQGVGRGRRREIQHINGLPYALGRLEVPDPELPRTCHTARLDWDWQDDPAARDWFEFHRRLLEVRRTQLIPRLSEQVKAGCAHYLREGVFCAEWRLDDGQVWSIMVNLTARSFPLREPLSSDWIYQSTGRPWDDPSTLPGYALSVATKTALHERFHDET